MLCNYGCRDYIKNERNVVMKEEKRTLYDDMDEALLKAVQLVKADLPEKGDSLEQALVKIVIIINKLCERINSKIIRVR